MRPALTLSLSPGAETTSPRSLLALRIHKALRASALPPQACVDLFTDIFTKRLEREATRQNVAVFQLQAMALALRVLRAAT